MAHSRQIDASGDFLGSYQYIEDLGVGGYSRVKLAIDARSKQYVAVKILLSEPVKVKTDDAESTEWRISDSKIKQCKREVGLMSRIQHKNVVALHDFVEDATFPQKNAQDEMVPTPCLCVVLEYCSRGELFDFLMYTGRLGDRATRTYFQQFLNGLKAMHDSGYAHRDLKPENLLLADDFTLKIADFGFATQFKDQRKKIKMATTCGTKGYLAPELLAGHKYTHKVDLFAVGIIMFTTFAGFPPFQHAGSGDWWWDKMSKAWTYWTEAPNAKNDIEKNERFKKGNEKMRLFWAAHERSLPFEDKFKDLMQRLLNPFPKQRYDIDDCFKHPWMKGKTFSRKQLIKYMKQYSATVRAQRAIKIEKQLKDQNMDKQRENAMAKRAVLDHTSIEQLERQANDFAKVCAEAEENEAILNKANFKMNSRYSMYAILTSLDIVARQNQSIVDMNVDKCELKIISSIHRVDENTRLKEVSKAKKAGKTSEEIEIIRNTNYIYKESEDVTIVVKIYKENASTFDEIDISNFDIEGTHIEDEKDESELMDKDDTKSEETSNNDNKDETTWALYFYRVLGSSDSYQKLMEAIFYNPLVSSLMDHKQFIPENASAIVRLNKMEEHAGAFRDTFFKIFSLDLKTDEPQEENDALPDNLPAIDI